MQRKVRVIKQNDPLVDKDEEYVDRHEKSLIALLVPRHIDYTRRLVKEAERQGDVLVAVAEGFRLPSVVK